jgi:hypothetical protein
VTRVFSPLAKRKDPGYEVGGVAGLTCVEINFCGNCSSFAPGIASPLLNRRVQIYASLFLRKHGYFSRHSCTVD